MSKLSYADTRLASLGITAQEYTFQYYPKMLPYIDRREAVMAASLASHQYLDTDRNDNLLIYYPTPDAAGILYNEAPKTGYEIYHRTRRNFDKSTAEAKYLSPPESGINIFIPAKTLHLIRTASHIDTLIINEGEIKSIFVDHYGLPCIGIQGIHMFITGKGIKRLHPTLEYILQTCTVKRVILLFDSDTINVNFDFQNSPEHDYAKRLINFHAAVLNYKAVASDYNKRHAQPTPTPQLPSEAAPTRLLSEVEVSESEAITFYFAHIKSSFLADAKGIDDLYAHSPPADVNADLMHFTRSRYYFNCFNIGAWSIKEIKAYFYLDTDQFGIPTGFYNRFSNHINDSRFFFDGSVYRYNESSDTLDIVYHRDLKDYIRVGPDYYRLTNNSVAVLKQGGNQVIVHKPSITRWNKAEIRQDYIEHKGIKNTFFYIKKYTGFCNIPLHGDDYQREIETEYNRYHPMIYQPSKGSWLNTEKFLKHIFQNKYQNTYDVAMDLFQLKYTMPLQKLPVTVLFSPEKNTGKSTLLFWLNEMYGDNAAVIGQQTLDDNFNEYMTSNVMLFDEAFIDKTRIMEMIKSWTTLTEVSINQKNKDRQKVRFFSSIFMTTNRINFAVIDEDENRFFVNRVPPISDVDLDPDLLNKMISEIPAFLYHLKYERELAHQKKTRFWFDFNLLKTPALSELKYRSQKMSLRAFRTYVRQIFIEYQIIEFEITPSMLARELRRYASRDISQTEVENMLKEDLGMTPGKVHRFRFPQWINNTGTDELQLEMASKYFDPIDRVNKYYTGATYTLKAEKLLEEEELKQLYIEINIKNSHSEKPIQTKIPLKESTINHYDKNIITSEPDF